jgi:small subunit ribosomal protein S10e
VRRSCGQLAPTVVLRIAEGVIVVKKDDKKEKHDILDVSNLHAMKLLQSMKSRQLVKETYNWQYLYFSLTDKGIEYLREYLSIPADTVPETLKVKAVMRAPRPDGPRGDRPRGDRPGGRGGYREGGFGGRGFGAGRGRAPPATSE